MSHTIYKLLERLDSTNIHYVLNRFREDIITAKMSAPNTRIEVDVESNGSFLISYFKGSEGLTNGPTDIDGLLELIA